MRSISRCRLVSILRRAGVIEVGEISRELEPKQGQRIKGGEPMESLSTGSKIDTLSRAGISPRVANNCEAIAAVPEER